MGAIDTNYTFTATDVITSTKMNNILDQSTITATAVFNNTLDVASGKLLVKAGGITANELAANSVTTTAITDLNITTGKIATGAITLAKMAADSVGIDQIADASITAPMLNGLQSGSAPIYGARAWVAYDPIVPISPEFSGTYSRSGTTVTVVAAGHGLKTGSLVKLNFISGLATDGEFIITGVSTTTVANDTFTITHTASGTTNGNVGIPRATITGSGNVSSVTIIDTGRQVINFTIEMSSSTSYAVVATPEVVPSVSSNISCDIVAKYIGACQIRAQVGNSGVDEARKTSVIVIG